MIFLALYYVVPFILFQVLVKTHSGWVTYDLDAPQCVACGEVEKNYLCGTDFGVIPDHLTGKFANKCIRYEPPNSSAIDFVTRERVFSVLGNDAVIAFVGDSNARFSL